MNAHLSIRGLGMRFGGLQALQDVSFDVQRGSITGVMGSNGAGKTTLFATIAGNLQPTTGSIELNGVVLNGKRPDQICHLGVARTFQIVRPFAGLTVLENLRTAALFGRAQKRTYQEADEIGLQVLSEVGLERVAGQLASTLTLSNLKRLELARAIASGAELVLLDEVMAGLTPTEVAEMLDMLRRLQRSRGLTLLIIEHVMRALMNLCSQIVVLHHGRFVTSGTPQEVGADQRVLAAYFGEGHA